MKSGPSCAWAVGARLAVLALFLGLAHAESGFAQSSPRLVIEHSDQIQRLAQGDSVSYYLDGSVRARRGDLHMSSQHAVLLDWLGLLDLSRDVHLWDAEKELYANHVSYTDSIDVAVATGDVQIIDRKSGSQLKSQHAVYDRTTGTVTATQKPEMILFLEEEESAESGADAAAAADSAPVPIRVWSEQVQFFRDSDDVWATGDVLIRRGETLTAKADSVHFLNGEDRLELRSKPRVETDRFYVESGEMDLLLPGDELETMLARGRAKALSISDSIPAKAVEALGKPSPTSWLAGDTLRFAFDDGLIRTLRAIGDARSLNYALESRTDEAATWALSYLMAGTILLSFDSTGRGVERVQASREGRGVYRTAAVTVGDVEEPPADGEDEPPNEVGATGGEARPSQSAPGKEDAGADNAEGAVAPTARGAEEVLAPDAEEARADLPGDEPP